MNCGHILALSPDGCPQCEDPPEADLDPDELLEQARAEKSYRRLADFVRYSWHVLHANELEWGFHLDAICDHVQWALEAWAAWKPGQPMPVQNLMINIPPRSLKSHIVSVCAVAWAWLHWPDLKFITLSDNPRVAADNARFCRDLIESGWYQGVLEHAIEQHGAHAWRLKDDRDAVSDYGIEISEGDGWRPGGFRKSRGWTTRITGEGADVIIPDDPHDAEEVHTAAARKRVWQRWKNAIFNRVQDGRRSLRIAVMQRLRVDDWAGEILAEMTRSPAAPQWVWLSIPLEFDPASRCVTPIWRDPRELEGEVIDADRYPPSFVAAEKERLGSLYSAIYNQRPKILEGGLLKRLWWNFFRMDGVETAGYARPLGCGARPALALDRKWTPDWLTISVDATFKKEGTSRVGLGVIAGKGAQRFILHDSTKKRSFNESKDAIRELRARWPATKVLIEAKANGEAIVDDLKAEIAGLILVEPKGGKDARASAVEGAVQAGNVYLLEGAEWVSDWIDEVSGHPEWPYDDRLDWFTQVMVHHASRGGADLFRALAQL